MAKKGFASSIGSALEGRGLSSDIIDQDTEVKELKKAITNQSNEEQGIKSKETNNKIIQKAVTKKSATKPKNEEKEYTAIGFNLTFEDARYIHRASIRYGISKEKLFDTIFNEMLDYEIDENDPDYILFSERFKKESRCTTRIDVDLYKKMQKTAANNYLKINGYINYVIRKYRLKNKPL